MAASQGSVIRDAEGNLTKVVVVSRDVTERTIAERQLRLLAQTIASTRDCITVTDLHDNILFANDAFLRTYGYAEEEILGQNVSLVRSLGIPPETARSILPATLEGGWHGEILNRRKNGSEFPVELWTSPVRDYSGTIVAMVGVARDVTERKRVEESERKLLRAVEQTDEVILMTSPEGMITYVNPAFEKVYGFTRLEILGKTPAVLKSGEMTGEFYEKFWKDLASGKSVRTELVNRTKSGKLVTIDTSTSPIIDEQGTVSGFIAVQNDVTEQRNTEDQKRALEHQLAQVQKMESIGTLAGGIAHDFNNILAIISGYASVLEGFVREPARFSQGVDAIQRAADRGASLVRQILTFARKTEVLFEPISVNDIITELGKMIQQTFPKNIRLELRLERNINLVNGDRTQLHQALLNFCVNARDAMPDGGNLTISTSMMSGTDLRGRFLEAKREQYVCVSVSDTGAGMDEETKSRLFEPFFTTKEKGKGTGLGLAVVYGIVRSHYGHVDFDSTLGQGTTFTLYLPVSLPQESLLVLPEEIRAEIQGGAETILLVEDEDTLRELVASLLREQGYSVLQAADGEEAVQVYAEHADHIALVVTDLGLPKLSGWQAFRKMRALKPSVKAILATGYLEPMLKSEIAESGVMEFLQKPYRPAEIFRKVREAIDGNS
jgi:two-component system cell cycle sensor histidine kinase/response regulator CckA